MNTPKIRFKGFKDDWEQRKVGEVTKELLDYDNFSSGLPLLTSSRSGLMYQSEYRGNATTENENTLFSVVPLNACTYRHMSDDSTFHLNINTLEKGLVSKEYPVFQENESNLKFIVQYINSSNSFTKFCTEQKKGGTRTRLYYKTLCEYKLMMPSIKEQNKTANFFDTLDHLITLHQRKCDETKQLKKFMLQKMFPKNGEKNPKIRFEGFTDDWEQRKLGDVFKEYSEKHHEELPALTIVQGGGTIFREESDRSLQYDKSNLSGYKMVKKDDFIVHLRSFEGGLEKANSDGIISPAYHTMHGDNVDSRFYYPYFRSYDFINRKLVAHVYGIRDGRSIDIDGMKSIEIPYTFYEEQKTIGDYLDSLDHLITLHQRKCEKLKELKKYMLHNMFV